MAKIEEFLGQLEEELRYLKPKDAADVIKYYRNRINIAVDYGEKPEHVIAKLPTPQKIAEDTYASKGIDYLDRRKKQLRQSQIVKAFFSTILVLMIVVAFISYLGFVGYMIVKIFKLLISSFSMVSIIDIISLFIFTLFYVLLLLVISIYIIDVLYIIFGHFLLNILDVINKKEKDYKFLDFTISGFIEEKIGKKRFVLKVLLCILAIFATSGVTNFASKGYIYRSMNDVVEVKGSPIIIKKQIKQIIVKPSNAFVKIKQDDNAAQIRISYGFEFNHNLDYEISGTDLIINNIKIEKYDLFGLLDEPLPIIEIIVPSRVKVENIDINLTNGYFDMVDVDNDFNLKLSGYNSIYAITRSSFNNLEVNGASMDINNEENVINDVNLTMTTGRFCAVNDHYENLISEVSSITLILQNDVINNATLKTRASQMAIDKTTISNLDLTDGNSECYFRDYSSENSTIFAQGSSSISLERVVTNNSLTLKTSVGSIVASFLKTPLLDITIEKGKISLDNVSKDSNIKDEELKPYIDNYNNAKFKTAFTSVINEGSLVCNNNNFENLNLTMTDANVEFNTNTIINSTVKMTKSVLTINDLDGEKIAIDVSGNNLYFYNNNITSKIVLTLTGDFIKTNVYIGDNITRNNEQE